MPYIKNYILIFILIGFACRLQAQETTFNKADSLISKKLNVLYLKELNSIAEKLEKSDNEEVILKVNRKLLEYYRLYEFNKDSIHKYYNQGIHLATKYNNTEYKTNFDFMWADYQVSIGNYTEALSLFQSLEATIEKNNYDFLPHFYDSYARLFYYLKKYNKAFEFLKKEAKIFEQRKKDINIAAVYNNLGILYKSQKQIDSSLYYHQKVQEINLKVNDTINIIKTYSNIGQTYFADNNLLNAEKYYLLAYNFAPEKATNSLLNNYATLLLLKGENLKAERFLLKVKKETQSKEMVKNALTQLVTLKKTEKEFEQALIYQEELNLISKELLDEIKIKEIERLEILHKTTQKEQKILALQEKNTIQKSIINKNKLIVIIALLLLFFTIILFILLSRNKSNQTKINKLLMQQRLLRSQMNPHFIFNALSNIQTNILKKENTKAVKYLVKFSKLLRYNLDNTNLNTAIFSKEIQSITDYLDMQNLRLGNALQYQFFIDDSIEQDLINIPSMMLQPIIENAIEHGIETIVNPKITITITNQIKYLQCVITDNGIGYSNALKNKKDSKKSFSTKSIKERLLHLSKKTNLNLTYVIKDLMEENRTIIGTKAIIKLPIIEG